MGHTMMYLGRGFCGSLTTSLYKEQMGFYVGSQHFQMKKKGQPFLPTLSTSQVNSPTLQRNR